MDRKWPELWAESAMAKGLLHLLFASPCAVCGADDGPFCDDCRDEMLDCGSQCPRCALASGPYADLERGCSSCRDHPQGFDQAIALGPYQGPIRELCLRLKIVHNAWLSRWAADLLLEAHGERLRSTPAHLIVPVPLHWHRQVIRGYNQAQAIAEPLARRLGIPLRTVLTRTIWTTKQVRLGKSARKSQLRGAFRAVPNADLKGKTVILVDDILTTGATCGECARALKKAGAKRVIAVVLGRAEGSA